jgi:hypothetical protein
MVSHPGEVVSLIEAAADGTGTSSVAQGSE